MKYLLYLEFDPKDREKVKKTEAKNREERKNKEKYGKTIFSNHAYEYGKFISVVECDNPKQLANRIQLAAPYIRIKPVPLVETALMRESEQEIIKLRESWQ